MKLNIGMAFKLIIAISISIIAPAWLWNNSSEANQQTSIWILFGCALFLSGREFWEYRHAIPQEVRMRWLIASLSSTLLLLAVWILGTDSDSAPIQAAIFYLIYFGAISKSLYVEFVVKRKYK